MSVEDFRTKIKEFCKSIGKNQQDLAKELNISYVALNRKLNDKRTLTAIDAKQIIVILVEWEAVNSIEEVIELFSLLQFPAFSEEEWSKPPLNRLLPDNKRESSTSAFVRKPKKNKLDVLPPHNLPQQLTEFVGRKVELASISKQILANSRNTKDTRPARLLTLVGPAGCGKTRLGIEVARSLLYFYKDGVWFISLRGFNNPDLIYEALTETLNIREQSNQVAQGALLEFLQNKRILLLLDNCEHLLEATRTLARDLLKNCPNVAILATSREKLHLEEFEIVFQVPPMSLPQTIETSINYPDLDDSTHKKSNNRTNLDVNHTQFTELKAYDAIELFLKRAQKVQPSFKLRQNNATTVVEICQRLDGLPLALELAAARLDALSLQQINLQLNQRFRLLSYDKLNSENSQHSQHHQTLRASIDWSYKLLTSDEQILLAYSSVFTGGFYLNAVFAIFDAPKQSNESVILEQALTEKLKSLVNKNLVIEEKGLVNNQQDEEAEIRFSLLETIREYASEQLAKTGKSDDLKDKHAAYYTQFAEQADSELRGANQLFWLKSLEQELNNIRQALVWLLDSDEPENIYLLISITSALGLFWIIRGYVTEGERWNKAVLAKLKATFNNFPDVSSLVTTADFLLIAKLGNFLHTVAMLYESQGKYNQAKQWYQISLEFRNQVEDEKGKSRTLNNLGNIALFGGEYEQAQYFYTQSLALREKLGDRTGVGMALHNLGVIASRQGDYTEAQNFFEQALEVQRQLNDNYSIAENLHNLGTVMQDQGKLEEAKKFFQESLVYREKLEDKRGITYTINNLAAVATYQEDFEQAETLYKKNLDLVQELADTQAYIYYLLGKGKLAEKQRNYAEAHKIYTESLKLSWDLNDKQSLAFCLEGRAWLAFQEQRIEEACKILVVACQLREIIKSPLSPIDASSYHEKIVAIEEKLGSECFRKCQLENFDTHLEQVIVNLTNTGVINV